MEVLRCTLVFLWLHYHVFIISWASTLACHRILDHTLTAIRNSFCSEVGGRGNFQLRAWELEEPADEESKIFVDAPPPRHDSQSTHRSADETSLEETKAGKASEGAVPNVDEMAAIAPFAIAASTADQKARIVAPFLEPFGDGRLSMTHPPFADDVPREKPLPRPKVFGPERPVEDPRVKALHERLMREMYGIAVLGIMVGPNSQCRRGDQILNASYAQVFSAVIFSVPCGHSR